MFNMIIQIGTRGGKDQVYMHTKTAANFDEITKIYL